MPVTMRSLETAVPETILVQSQVRDVFVDAEPGSVRRQLEEHEQAADAVRPQRRGRADGQADHGDDEQGNHRDERVAGDAAERHEGLALAGVVLDAARRPDQAAFADFGGVFR